MKKNSSFLVAGFLLATVTGVNAGDVNYSFSGQLRYRPEMSDNYDFDSDTDDRKAFVGQRIRLNVKAKVGDDIEAFVQAQDSRNWGAKASNVTAGDEKEAIDLFQAYFQLNNAFKLPVDLKMGRQTLAYGDQRLLGHLGWKESARSFDAYKLIFHIGESQLDLFSAKLKESGKPSSTIEDEDLYGLYSTWKLFDKTTLDLYYLIWQDDKSKNVGTYGARLAGEMSGIDFTIESALQGGDWSETKDQEASALAVKVGYTMANIWKTRIGLEYDNGSGDDDPKDNKHKTFVFPFHTNHGHYGYMDFFSWGNMQDIRIAIKTNPMNSKTVVKFSLHNFKIDQAEDVWLNEVGIANKFATDTGGTSTDAGQEYDLTVVHSYNKNLKIVGGYSLFMPGKAAKERANTSNKGDTAQWGYAMFVLNI